MFVHEYSAYLTYGNISHRYVVQALRHRQKIERERKVKGGKWLKSLAAFGSRLRWRSHFIQKFES